jgi:hypothetical protein
MAIVLLGEELALYALLVLLAVLSLAIWFSMWLVKRFKARLGKRAYLLPVGVFIVLGSGLYLPFWLDRPNAGPPHEVLGPGVQSLINGLPQNAEFGYSGLAYFQDKLYVATNVGLAELENGNVIRLFQFQKEYSVVSGPWVDQVNQLLWALDDETFELLSFNGKKWRRFPMPSPQNGYYTRGDVLTGVRAALGQRGLVFTAGDGAWEWDVKRVSWSALTFPPGDISVAHYAALFGVLPLDKNIFLIRHERFPFMLTKQQNFSSDTAVFWNNGWIDVPNRTGLNFFADEWTIADNAAYICTQRKELLQVSLSEISLVNGPGPCETVTTNDVGNLLVSFQKLGIYELTTNGWQRRALPLYPSGAGDYWTHLAAHGDEMAYAIEGKSVVDNEKSEGTHMAFTRNAPTHLWVMRSGTGARLVLPRP